MNKRDFLKEVVTLLEDNNIKTWIFGGWAEELSGISEAKEHKDIDLLYPGKNFNVVDAFISKNKQIEEIKEKRFYHKRAFLYKGIMAELFLVMGKKGHLYTNFWGTIYNWPRDLLDSSIDNFRVASKSALIDYRKNYTSLRSNL